MPEECIPCNEKKGNAAQQQQSRLAAIPDLNHQLVRPMNGFTPAVYRFRDEQESPVTFEDVDLNNLLARIVQYRFENKLPEILYLKEVVIHYTMLSDDAYAPYRQHYYTAKEVHISAAQYLKSALAFVKANTIYTEDELFVSKENAEHRAQVCLNCPRNLREINGKTVNTPSLAQSKFCELAKGRTTDYDNALGICGVCACMNKCKIHFRPGFIKDASTDPLLQQFNQEYVGLNGRPMRCWISSEVNQKDKSE